MQDYSTSLTKRLVLDVAEQTGFQSVRTNACDILSELVASFVKSLGKQSCTWANLSGRTEVGLQDVVSALDDIHYNPQDISNYIDKFDESIGLSLQPFDHDVPSFPKKIPSTIPIRGNDDPVVMNLNPILPVVIPPQQDTKIPPFLAPFPPKHTYKFTNVLNDRIKDPNVIQDLKTKQKRNVETSLTKIHSKQLENEKFESKPQDIQPITNPYLNAILGNALDDSLYDVGSISIVQQVNQDTIQSDSTESILLVEKKRNLETKDTLGKKRRCDEVLSIDYHQE